MDKEICRCRVFEPAFPAFGEGSTKRASDDDVRGGFGKNARTAPGNVHFGRCEVRLDLGETLSNCCGDLVSQGRRKG